MGYEVDFLPVGDSNGDAICIRYGDAQQGYGIHVVDGAFKDTGEEIMKHIRQYYGVEHVHNMVLSHADNDHAPGLIRVLPASDRVITARATGVVSCTEFAKSAAIWQVDLNKEVPKSPKPWVANARAMPIVPGVWQLPGGRVESDLGGQRVIEAPDGLILIEGHAGLSFDREWAAMEAVGLDPKRVKYVLDRKSTRLNSSH